MLRQLSSQDLFLIRPPVLLWVVDIYRRLEEKSGSASEEEGLVFRNSVIKYYHDSLITNFTSSNAKKLFLRHRWDIWDVHSAGDGPLNADEYLIFMQICSCFQAAVMTARFQVGCSLQDEKERLYYYWCMCWNLTIIRLLSVVWFWITMTSFPVAQTLKTGLCIISAQLWRIKTNQTFSDTQGMIFNHTEENSCIHDLEIFIVPSGLSRKEPPPSI